MKYENYGKEAFEEEGDIEEDPDENGKKDAAKDIPDNSAEYTGPPQKTPEK